MTSLGFFRLLQEIKEALRSGRPRSEIWDQVRGYLGDRDVEREFWRMVETPEWLEFLRSEGRFINPPAPLRTEKGIQFPVWWASKYLATMAAKAPQAVAQIFRGIETTNASVLGDMLDAAIAMQSSVAATLVQRISKAVAANLVDFKKTSDLCDSLAVNDQIDGALALADALFAPRSDKTDVALSGHEEYWQRHALEKFAPRLATSRPIEFLPRLCVWLRTAINEKGPSDKQFDFSTIWRPAIEEHEQNNIYDFAGWLVGLARKLFEETVSSNRIGLSQALSILEREQFIAFKRLRLHLINHFAEKNVALARETMMDRSMFDNVEFKHEYAMLIGQRFLLLDPSERAKWLNWVEAGPDLVGFDLWIKRVTGKDATNEDRDRHKRYWKFQRLHWIRNYLDSKDKQFYEEMLAEHGEPKLADLNSYHESGFGVKSPIRIEEIQNLSFAEAVDKIATWRSEKTAAVALDELEGLMSLFRQYLAANAEQFSKEASILTMYPMRFVAAFVEQMSLAVQAGKAVDIVPVIELCEWILNRTPISMTGRLQQPINTTEHYERMAREGVPMFVEMVCKARVGKRPKFLRDGLDTRFAKLLNQIVRDPAESSISDVGDEQDVRNLDYLSHALNSPRGKAVGALLEYARWIADQIKQGNGEGEKVPNGFSSIPMAQEILEWQIGNPSFASSAILGANTGLLYWIDKTWIAANVPRIFDLRQIETNSEAASGWVAWNAFLVWVHPHIEFYRLLRTQFAYAVEQTAYAKIAAKSDREPMYRLGEHLMVLYARGQLAFDDDDGLLRRFFSHSIPEIRRHAIEFIGVSLRNEKPLEIGVAKRLQDLWDFYWPQFGSKDVVGAKGLRLGSWFEAGEFPNDWFLTRLQALLEAMPSVDLDRSVVERLAELAPTDIGRVTGILDKMLPIAEGSWRLWDWREPAKKVLAVAVKNPETQDLAERIIDRLGRRGLNEFGDLLKNSAN